MEEKLHGAALASAQRANVTPEMREAIAKEYPATERQRGRSIRSLAQEYGVAYGTVHRIIKKAGIPFRSTGGPHGFKNGPQTASKRV